MNLFVLDDASRVEYVDLTFLKNAYLKVFDDVTYDLLLHFINVFAHEFKFLQQVRGQLRAWFIHVLPYDDHDLYFNAPREFQFYVNPLCSYVNDSHHALLTTSLKRVLPNDVHDDALLLHDVKDDPQIVNEFLKEAKNPLNDQLKSHFGFDESALKLLAPKHAFTHFHDDVLLFIITILPVSKSPLNWVDELLFQTLLLLPLPPIRETKAKKVQNLDDFNANSGLYEYLAGSYIQFLVLCDPLW